MHCVIVLRHYSIRIVNKVVNKQFIYRNYYFYYFGRQTDDENEKLKPTKIVKRRVHYLIIITKKDVALTLRNQNTITRRFNHLPKTKDVGWSN